MTFEEVVEETRGASAGRGDPAFLGDLSHQLAHRFLAPWRCSFLGFQAHQPLSIADIMIGAAALAHRAFGELWPTRARLAVHPGGSGDVAAVELREALPRPDKNACVLQTPSHWMLLVDMGTCFYGLDGVGHPHLAELSTSALADVSFFRPGGKPIEYPRLWCQEDDWSCGFYVLMAFSHFLSGVAADAWLFPPSGWDQFAQELNSAAVAIGVRVLRLSNVAERLSVRETEAQIRALVGMSAADALHPHPIRRTWARLRDAEKAMAEVVSGGVVAKRFCIVFAEQKPSGSGFVFHVGTYAGLATAICPAVDNPPEQQAFGPVGKQRLYEVLDCRPAWLHFDIEFHTDQHPNLSGDALMGFFYTELDAFTEQAFGAPVDPQAVVELDATTDAKFSKHVVVKGLTHGLFAFRDNLHVGEFAKALKLFWTRAQRRNGGRTRWIVPFTPRTGSFGWSTRKNVAKTIRYGTCEAVRPMEVQRSNF